MRAKALPVLVSIANPDDYPYSRAKMQIRGNWYIPGGGRTVLMIPVPVRLGSGMEYIGWQCQECRKKFIVDSLWELYHECMGVQ